MRLNEILAATDFSIEKSKLNPAYEPISVDVLAPYTQQILFANKCTPLYRGMKNTGDYIIADGNKMNRKSANTENYFTLLTEIMPSWSGWPPRSKSFVGSLEIDYASDYTDQNNGLYRIVPLENQDIGILPGTDLHNYFNNGYDTLMGYNTEEDDIIVSFNRELRFLLSLFYESEPTTANELVSAIKSMEGKIQESEEIQERILNTCYVLGEIFVRPNLFENINTLIDPETNECVLVGLSHISDGDSEIWLSGKVLFIKEDIFENVVSSLKSNKSKKD